MEKPVTCRLSIIFFSIIFFLLSGCYSKPVQPGEETAVLLDAETFEDEEEEIPEESIPVEFELPPPDANLPVSSFREIWAYLVAGRESALNLNYPVTDLVYFGAEVDSYGKLVDIPNFRNISSFRGRKHFVAACSSRSLTHFVLMEGSSERRALIRDLLEAARPYDGLQIDFEYVPARDGEAFLSFLRELRSGLGGKVFSIALAARTRTLSDDVYDYTKIKPIVDRILVMAYDEHWSGSEPGPVASIGWCQRVARYSLDTIGAEKLIMGLPFYGRSWANENLNVAYVHSTVERVMREQNVKEVQRENGIPYFKYTKTLSATVYYEDAYSLSARLDMYKKAGVNYVGFWRLGQETGEFWSVIGLEKDGS
jgi:spore germination protein YaaH